MVWHPYQGCLSDRRAIAKRRIGQTLLFRAFKILSISINRTVQSDYKIQLDALLSFSLLIIRKRCPNTVVNETCLVNRRSVRLCVNQEHSRLDEAISFQTVRLPNANGEVESLSETHCSGLHSFIEDALSYENNSASWRFQKSSAMSIYQ